MWGKQASTEVRDFRSQEWLIGRFSYTAAMAPPDVLRPRRKTEKEVVLLLNEKRTEVLRHHRYSDDTFSALARE
jgi:hypothetical protein